MFADDLKAQINIEDVTASVAWLQPRAEVNVAQIQGSAHFSVPFSPSPNECLLQ